MCASRAAAYSRPGRNHRGRPHGCRIGEGRCELGGGYRETGRLCGQCRQRGHHHRGGPDGCRIGEGRCELGGSDRETGRIATMLTTSSFYQRVRIPRSGPLRLTTCQVNRQRPGNRDDLDDGKTLEWGPLAPPASACGDTAAGDNAASFRRTCRRRSYRVRVQGRASLWGTSAV